MHDLAKPTGGRHLLKGNIVVRDHSHEVLVRNHPNPRITTRVLFGNSEGGVLASVINNDILPILVGLLQDAFNALAQMGVTIIDGSEYAHQWLVSVAHRYVRSQNVSPFAPSFMPSSDFISVSVL
jgi:hypothetical protein